MRYLKILLLCLLACVPAIPSAFVAPAQITLESQNNWGDANPQDIQAALQSVIEVIAPYTAGRKFGTIIVRKSNAAPISLYEKGVNGEYIVMLNVQGRHWSQLAYQFSHEMCHLMSNYDLAPNNISRQQWFEEALCEAFSLFTLERMAAYWAEHPPYPGWKDYAPRFTEYLQDNMMQTHRRLPLGMKLPTWYQEYHQLLSDDPIARDRDLNELVANQLLPVFKANPENWMAINYLNLGDDRGDKSLQKYLHDWEQSTPPNLQAPVREIRKLLLKNPA